jgi:hypothetical protein
MSIAFSNHQRLSSCSRAYRGCWICEAHGGESFWKQDIQHPRMEQQFCDFPKQSETEIYEAQSLSVSADLCPLFPFAHVVFVSRHNLRNCPSRYT